MNEKSISHLHTIGLSLFAVVFFFVHTLILTSFSNLVEAFKIETEWNWIGKVCDVLFLLSKLSLISVFTFAMIASTIRIQSGSLLWRPILCHNAWNVSLFLSIFVAYAAQSP